MTALSPRAEAITEFDFLPRSAYFQEANGSHVLPTSGTLGTGVEFRYSFSDNLKWRYSHNTLDESQSRVRHSIHYGINLQMFTHPVILDWHPFGGRFRASTGVVLNGTNVSVTAHSIDHITLNGLSISTSDVQQAVSNIDPTQIISSGQWSIQGADVIQYAASLDSANPLTINGQSIPMSELGSVSAKVRYPHVAPYLGFGWGNTDGIKATWLYSIDVGVMYLGRPKVDLSLNGTVAEVTDKYFSAETEAYLSQERQKIESSLQKYRYFPVFSISLWYRF
ncbi:MAG: hypothetical protein NUV51_13275 [Sulfuricaulis sp.]|nr:hypothetical protein [Sulfuricaulis sp.]